MLGNPDKSFSEFFLLLWRQISPWNLAGEGGGRGQTDGIQIGKTKEREHVFLKCWGSGDGGKSTGKVTGKSIYLLYKIDYLSIDPPGEEVANMNVSNFDY